MWFPWKPPPTRNPPETTLIMSILIVIQLISVHYTLSEVVHNMTVNIFRLTFSIFLPACLSFLSGALQSQIASMAQTNRVERWILQPFYISRSSGLIRIMQGKWYSASGPGAHQWSLRGFQVVPGLNDGEITKWTLTDLKGILSDFISFK